MADPRAMVRRFIEAVETAESKDGDDEDWLTARDAAIELHEWLDAKGFPPQLTKKQHVELWSAIAEMSSVLVSVLRGED
jgi:hypothetical protein